MIAMNTKLLLLAIAAFSITSCSTAYKSGQTPDDVYYSPIRGIDEKDNVKQDNTKEEGRIDNYEEREIRMSTRDRRWRDINDDYDYSCRYDPYHYGYNYGYYYNPYYYNRPVFLPGYTIVNPKNNTPRMTNLGSYNNNTLVVSNTKTGQTKWVQTNKSYNNSNNNSGSFIRRIITPITSAASSSGSTSTRSSGSESNNTRTYTPSSSNSGSSSSGSSGRSSGGSVTRPPRGN